MNRRVLFAAVVMAMAVGGWSFASEISGYYMETRTCQVYTGPCFANAETGLAGKDAIMAWNIQKGKHADVDVSGLNVVVVVAASNTLGFKGMGDAESVRSVILVDDRANSAQRDALIDFARSHSGKAGKDVARIASSPIDMTMNVGKLTGELKAGREVTLKTRKAGRGDCICSNESAYYPPLAKVEYFAPGVTIEGGFVGKGLKTQWTTPGARSSYMATFTY